MSRKIAGAPDGIREDCPNKRFRTATAVEGKVEAADDDTYRHNLFAVDENGAGLDFAVGPMTTIPYACELSLAEMKMCDNLLMDDKFFCLFSSYTNVIPNMFDPTWTEQLIMTQVQSVGHCIISFDKLAALHPDANIRRMMPNYIKYWYDRLAETMRSNNGKGIEKHTGYNFTDFGGSIGTNHYRLTRVINLNANFKQLFIKTGLVPQYVYPTGTSGIESSMDFIQIGDETEESYSDYPPACESCKRYKHATKVAEYVGSSLIVNYHPKPLLLVNCVSKKATGDDVITSVPPLSAIFIGHGVMHCNLAAVEDIHIMKQTYLLQYFDKSPHYRRTHVGIRYYNEEDDH